MNFSIKGFFSQCDQICSFLRIWSHLLKKSLLENFIFCEVLVKDYLRKFLEKIPQMFMESLLISHGILLRLYSSLVQYINATN